MSRISKNKKKTKQAAWLEPPSVSRERKLEFHWSKFAQRRAQDDDGSNDILFYAVIGYEAGEFVSGPIRDQYSRSSK